MPRIARRIQGGLVYHVINRGNGGAAVFLSDTDYAEFLRLLRESQDRIPIELFAWCLMPNHFHMVVRPEGDDDLGRWMQRLTTTHVRRHHKRHGTFGSIWQGRYKAFPVQNDAHLLTVLRYVERNPVRANHVDRAQDWRWSSAASRLGAGLPDMPGLAAPPVPLPPDWAAYVDEALTPAEIAAVRTSVNRERPFGAEGWVETTAARLGLAGTLRPRGRPRKST